MNKTFLGIAALFVALFSLGLFVSAFGEGDSSLSMCVEGSDTSNYAHIRAPIGEANPIPNLECMGCDSEPVGDTCGADYCEQTTTGACLYPCNSNGRLGPGTRCPSGFCDGNSCA
jgi:hypothetical protein